MPIIKDVKKEVVPMANIFCAIPTKYIANPEEGGAAIEVKIAVCVKLNELVQDNNGKTVPTRAKTTRWSYQCKRVLLTKLITKAQMR